MNPSVLQPSTADAYSLWRDAGPRDDPRDSQENSFQNSPRDSPVADLEDELQAEAIGVGFIHLADRLEELLGRKLDLVAADGIKENRRPFLLSSLAPVAALLQCVHAPRCRHAGQVGKDRQFQGSAPGQATARGGRPQR